VVVLGVRTLEVRRWQPPRGHRDPAPPCRSCRGRAQRLHD
jgi:hypothetical protein